MQCRMCLNTNTQSLWNDEKEDKGIIKTVLWYILQATGIQIEDTDKVPCVLCHNCIAVSINIYWFRREAIKKDKFLKQKYGQNYIPPLTRFEDIIEISEEEKWNLPEFVKGIQVKKVFFENNIKTENDVEDTLSVHSNFEEMKIEDVRIQVGNSIIDLKAEEELLRPQSPEKVFVVEARSECNSPLSNKKNRFKSSVKQSSTNENHVHSTVEKLLIANPGLNIPKDIRNCNINPIIQLNPFKKPVRPCVSKEFFTTSLELAPSQNTNHNTGLVRVDKSDNIYICMTCNKLFTSKRKLALHTKMHYLCQICFRSFSKKSVLEEHKKEFHSYPINKPATYSVTNNGNMKLTIQKEVVGLNSTSGIENQHPPTDKPLSPQEKAETDYVKYLLVNRYMHKTQQETQTEYKHLLNTPVNGPSSVQFKGIIKDLQTFNIPVKMKVEKNGLRGSIVHSEVEPKVKAPVYDFSHITPINIVSQMNETNVIDLVSSSPTTVTNSDKLFRRKRARTKSCDSRTFNLQNSNENIVDCENGSLNGAPGNRSVSSLENPKKLRVKQLWEIK